jgi:integrase
MTAGHIRKRGEKSWKLKFDVGTDIGGKRQIRYHSFKGTKREAQAELTRLIASANTGTYVDPDRATVSEFLMRWERDWAPLHVSPKTLERYSGLISKQIVPHIGPIPIQKLRPAHLSELYAKIVQSGLAPRTAGHAHRLLHRAFGIAVQWGVLPQNIVDNVSPPRVASTEIEIMREDDIRVVLEKLRGRTMYPIASLALATGMRRGELLALRWQDVDLDGGKLRVEQSLEQTKAGMRFKSPKTKNGRRTISLPTTTVSELRDHWKAQQEFRLWCGVGRSPDDALVFPAPDDRPRSPNGLTKEWRLAMKAVGLDRVTFHALRHTHASSLIAAGLDVLTISRRLGHGSPAITLGVYGHMFANTDDRAAQAIDALFARVFGGISVGTDR